MKPRKAGHRDKDDRQKAREMADMKSENSQLRRKVARLQREIDRLGFLKVEAEDDDEVLEPIQPKRKPGVCRICGTKTLKEMTTPSGTSIVSCTQCFARQTL